MVEISIVILTYNAQDYTIKAIKSIEEHYIEEVKSGKFEIIVCDNASTDRTLDLLRKYKESSKIKTLLIVENGGNIGFSAGNNNGVKHAKGKYVLFLNSDTVVYPKTLTYVLDFMEEHDDVGAATCKLINNTGAIDFNCHRGLPTPWNAFTYFTGLQKLFPKSKLFAGYTQGWKDMQSNHEVSVIEGAFLFIRKEIGDKIGWWNDDYFFYGEDIQFSFDILQLGYKIYYLGKVSTLHIGGVSSGIKKQTQDITTADLKTKIMLQNARFEAMKIFYRKNYSNKYPKFITSFILWVVEMKKRNTLQSL